MATDMATAMANSRKHKHRARPSVADHFAKVDRKRALRFTLILAVAIGIAADAGTRSLGAIVRMQRPAFADRVGGDPFAPLLQLQNEIATAPARIRRPDVEPLVREGLRREPLNPAALRLLSLHADADNRRRASQIYAHAAERLSRRDLITQLILIEQAVRANDARRALHHYDTALRTSEAARTILFPVLGAAIREDNIRRELIPYVRAGASWMPFFVQFAIRNDADSQREIARLLIAARAGTGRPELIADNSAVLIGTLVDQNQFALAEQVYLQIPGTSRAMLTDLTVNGPTTDPRFGPIGWSAIDNGSVGAVFETTRRSPRRNIRVFAISGATGVVLQRVLHLTPGAYRLSEERVRTVGDATSRAYWEMTCMRDGQRAVIWRSPSQSPAYRAAGVPGPIVPAGCTNQLLELRVSGGDNPDGLEFLISRFDLPR